MYNGQGVYCDLSTASEVFLIFTTTPYQYFSVFFLFALFSDEPELFLPKYSQTAILHAAHFRRVVNSNTYLLFCSLTDTRTIVGGDRREGDNDGAKHH